MAITFITRHPDSRVVLVGNCIAESWVTRERIGAISRWRLEDLSFHGVFPHISTAVSQALTY